MHEPSPPPPADEEKHDASLRTQLEQKDAAINVYRHQISQANGTIDKLREEVHALYKVVIFLSSKLEGRDDE
jgi:hypothetical protein